MSSTPSLAVECHDLSKYYSGKPALQGVDIELPEGKCLAIMGPNGAGKTTLGKLILGLESPTQGSAHVYGKPYSPNDGVPIGYLPEERGVFKDESVIDVLHFFANLKHVPKHSADNQIRQYLRESGLENFSKTKIARLSNGYQQKVHLGTALIGDPKLLILDEPTRGFDPAASLEFLKLMKLYKKSGTTIILITHDVREVEALSDEIAIIRSGELLLHSSRSDLPIPENSLSYTISSRPLPSSVINDLDLEYEDDPSGIIKYRFRASSTSDIKIIISKLGEHSDKLMSIDRNDNSIDEVYSKVVSG